jgi:TonB family protein
MKLLFTFILLFITTLCLAQQLNVIYLKNDGRYVQIRDSADYIRILSEPDSGSTFFNIKEIYSDGKKLIGKASVTEPIKFEGQCTTYYENGNKQSIHNYKGGLSVGQQLEFYPNGKPFLVKEFPDNIYFGHDEDDYLIVAEYDSLGTTLIKNGNGHYQGFNSNFTAVIEQGNIKIGIRNGQWQGRDETLKLNYTEVYNGGLLISGISVGKTGDTVKYSQARVVQPQFKGGFKAFSEYLVKNMVYPEYDREYNIQGRVFLGFVVEKDGTVSNISVLKSVDQHIDKEAVRVLKNSGYWIPGTEYGRKVRIHYTIPLNFALSH